MVAVQLMIYSLYGQPGSGKTTLGKLVAGHLDTPFIIDGDEFRGMFANENYGKEGREENIRNANAVATYLNKKGNDIVISLVNPYKHLRDVLRRNNIGRHDDWLRYELVEVLLQSNRELRKEYHVEDFEEGTPDYTMNTDRSVEDSWNELKEMLEA